MKKNSIIPEINSTAILFIDMQEKFVPVMPDNLRDVISSQKILLKGAKTLGLKVIATEQYPKGLGATITELSDIFDPTWPVIEKSTFSSMQEVEVRTELEKQPIKTVILVGIETHVCLLQTAIDCIEKGYQTIVLTDAVNSRKATDKETAFKTLESAGVILMTVESILFMLMRDSKHPAFREISKLLR